MMRSAKMMVATLAAPTLFLSTHAMAQEMQGGAEPASATTTIADKVKADWPKYDAGSKGHLTQAELGKWLSDLRTAAGQPAPDAKWQATAFSQTDSNGDRKVSTEELTAFLSSGK